MSTMGGHLDGRVTCGVCRMVARVQGVWLRREGAGRRGRVGVGGARRCPNGCRLSCCHEEGMESGLGGQSRTSELKLPKGRLGLESQGGRPL